MILRTSVSVLAHFDPDTADNSPAANVRKAERLLAQIPVAVAAQHRISKGLAPVEARGAQGGQAESFLYAAWQRGLCVRVCYDPEGKHDYATTKRLFPCVQQWLAPRLEPFAP